MAPFLFKHLTGNIQCNVLFNNIQCNYRNSVVQNRERICHQLPNVTQLRIHLWLVSLNFSLLKQLPFLHFPNTSVLRKHKPTCAQRNCAAVVAGLRACVSIACLCCCLRALRTSLCGVTTRRHVTPFWPPPAQRKSLVCGGNAHLLRTHASQICKR